ncbi:hypothetical protein FXO38_24406 [Capsicum annuum]|nr:hypothetical protein FXO38_24406 [Capsicum annuum]
MCLNLFVGGFPMACGICDVLWMVLLTMESEGSLSQPLENNAIGALMARLEALAQKMDDNRDAIMGDMDSMRSEMTSLMGGVIRMKAGVDRFYPLKPSQNLNHQVLDEMIINKDPKGVPQECMRNKLEAHVTKSAKKVDCPSLIQGDFATLNTLLNSKYCDLVSSEVVLCLQVHRSFLSNSIIVNNDQLSLKTSSLLEHENCMFENFQFSDDACIDDLGIEHGPLNLCNEIHDIILVHSGLVYVKVVCNTLNDCEQISLMKGVGHLGLDLYPFDPEISLGCLNLRSNSFQDGEDDTRIKSTRITRSYQRSWRSHLSVGLGKDIKKLESLIQLMDFICVEHLARKNHDRKLWKLGTLPLGLITFWKRKYALDQSWHVLGLGYNPNVSKKDIQRAAVIHYNRNLKPWFEISIPKFRDYWYALNNCTILFLFSTSGSYIQEEISGFRDDLFTARKSALNLIGVISLSKAFCGVSSFFLFPQRGLSSDIYSSLVKALTMSDIGGVSWYPVRVPTAAAIAQLIENEYMQPKWLPLLQVVCHRISNEEEDSSIYFQLLSTMAEAANVKI